MVDHAGKGSSPDASIDSVRKFLLAAIVALLAFSASGASALIVGEPCTGIELAGQDDGACPPTCVTCGCCAQASEPMVLQVAVAVENVVESPDIATPRLSTTPPRDILHVPKSPRS